MLLLIIARILFIAGVLSEEADTAYQDQDLVIGTLGRTQRDDVDAALCMFDTDRALAFLQTLDAQSNEDFQNPIISLDNNIDLGGMWMVESLHGGGSLEAEKIAMRAHYPLDHAKGLVRALARLTSG